MNKAIQAVVDSYIGSFISLLEEKTGMTKEQLVEIWEESQKIQPSGSSASTASSSPLRSKKASSGGSSSAKKPSAYLTFCKTMRPRLKANGLSFGEIAKELGRMWKEMSQEEKDTYKTTTPDKPTQETPDTDPSPLSVPETPVQETPAPEPEQTMEIVQDPPVVESAKTTSEEKEDATPIDEKPKSKRPKVSKIKKTAIPSDLTTDRQKDLWVELSPKTMADLQEECVSLGIKGKSKKEDTIRAIIMAKIALQDGETQLSDFERDEDMEEDF